ncbi:MAG: carbohydrate ABC transporter permease [Candidatus Methylomirabilia bacterium]
MYPVFKNRGLPYFLLAPSVAVIFVFLFVPSFQSLYLSFFKVAPFGNRRLYVGMENFKGLFGDPDYLNSIFATVVFCFFVVVAGLSLSLALALALNQKIPGISLYRTALIWPYAISPAIAGTIWALMFDPSTGALTYFVYVISGTQPNWMTNGSLALSAVTASATWKMVGYNVIFFLAGLQAVPAELLESAALDGAGGWQRFRRVTFPLLTPTTFFLIIMNALYGFFEVFGLIDIMTAGGPGRATEILVYKLYRDGFETLRTGYASAQSIVLFLFVAALTLIQFRAARRWVFYQ